MSKAEFCYPTSAGNLRSVDEFKAAFIPAYYDRSKIGIRMQRTLDLIDIHALQDACAMLDYGCGIGTFAYHAAEQRPTWSILGWDGDPTSIQIANACFRQPNVEFSLQPYDACSRIPQGEFDLISLLEVIEHVDNPGAILSGLRDGLRPGGMLLVSTPSSLGYNAIKVDLSRRLNAFIRRRRMTGHVEMLNAAPYDPTTHLGHIASYSLDTLARLMKLYGFDLVAFDIAPLSYHPHHRLLPETLILLGRKRT